jgi:predicted DNA binding protein
MDEPISGAPVGFVSATVAGQVRSMNEAAGRLLSITPGECVGRPVEEVVPRSVDDDVLAAIDPPPDERRSVEDYYPDLDRWLSVTIVPEGSEFHLVLEDVTAERRAKRRQSELEADLTRLTVTNELIADVLAALTDASAGSEIAATICDHLGGTDLYEFAWVGERKPGSDDLTVRATAGAPDRTLAAIETALDEGATIPERRAIESGTVEAVQPLGDDDSVPEPIRRAAFADGLQSLLAIPLRHGASVYGVVGVYAADAAAFTDRERRSFDTVGEMAGFAINATRQRSLLEASTVVEVTFGLADPEAPILAGAVEADATLSLAGVVTRGERPVAYLEVDDASPTAVASALQEADGVTATRVVSEHESAGSIEVTVATDSPIGLLLSEGATVRSATYEPGDHRITVELPPDADVRRIAEALTRRYDAEVLAKRERQPEGHSAADFREPLDARLTEYQETALRTALLAEYFESPRGSTAEEVADALDITGPTLLHHLRAGQRKLLEAYFETTTE